MPYQVFSVICELSKRVRLDVIEGGGKCNFAESAMTVDLSIPSRYAGHGRSSSAKPAMSRLANPSPLAGRSSKATAREIGPSQRIGLIFRPEGRFSR